MLCPHCGAQWQLPQNFTKIMKSCPFCGGDMLAALPELNTIEDVLREIVSRFGLQVFQDGDNLISLFSGLAPDLIKEKWLLEFFIECDGHANLLSMQTASASERVSTYQKQLQQMTERIAAVYNRILNSISIQVDPSAVEPIVTTEKYEYSDFGDGSIELTMYIGQIQEEIVFPAEYDGKKVVSVAGTILGASKKKDSDRTKIKSIYIPTGVTDIGNAAFQGCTSLTKVVLPNTLTNIGADTFKKCKALNNISLPNGLISIGKGAFSWSDLSSITIPSGIAIIAEETFKNCRSLVNVSLPNSLISIKDNAFNDCKSLSKIIIPKSVTTIGNGAFEGCKALSNFDLPADLKSIGDNAFSGCESLSSVSIPNSISFLGSSVFSSCTTLHSVCLPEGIKAIPYNTFRSCIALTDISLPDSVISIGDRAFEYCSSLTSISLPSKVV